jgi:hypothetical protein
MNPSRQRKLVFVGSLSLTALLLGALAGAGVVSRTLSRQMRDPKFLQQRLKELKDALCRLGRRDWFYAALGSLAALAVELDLPAALHQQLWEGFSEGVE